KILARNHQFLGVNRAIESVRERKARQGKLGVFWHTQGAGKSYSMVMFTRKVHRKLGGNFTFLVLTDRDDLDTQIYKTFAGCGVVNHDREPCRASGGKHLGRLLGQHKSYVFSLIQKFNQDVDPDEGYTRRDDIIVITDEAHRTQYGTLALNMRNALPNASYIGFTGTPLFTDDEITRRVFGEYVSTYDFQRAVEDKATVPLYYDARGDKLGIAIGDLNERIAEKLEELDEAFKEESHPFRIAIVCAMWLTGFDVPSLSTLYLDKPLKAHTLMQAIARANRVNEGKNNGLIVDYCGILKHLRKALATFAGTQPGGPGGETDPAKPDEELRVDLAEALALVRAFLKEQGASLDDVIRKTGFERNAAIVACKEAANENDETRKRFEVMCREVFKKFKACINVRGVNAHRADRDAINIVYKSLQQDREQADISDIIRRLHRVVDGAIETTPNRIGEDQKPYDISRIDFDKLKQEFERSPSKRTTVQTLKQAIETKLRRLLQQNPLRTDFQQHYEAIVAEYNREKDRVTIERTFEALLKLVQELDEEESRAVREGLDEESLAIFDLLKKQDLGAADIKRIKDVAVDLLETLKAEKLRIDQWRDKESTRDAVWVTIKDFLWSDKTGLPVDSYTEDDVQARTDEVFHHVFWAYPTVPSPYYESAAAA
ncbi:type I restriction endonuclease subunit R, partial [Thermodesulfobacteriota bacterium]